MFLVVLMIVSIPRRKERVVANHIHVAISNTTISVRRGITKRIIKYGRLIKIRKRSLMEIIRNKVRTKEVCL